MEPSQEPEASAPSLPEVIIRTIRHDVNTPVQTIYVNMHILLERLPREMELERRLVSQAHGQAQAIEEMIEVLYELICPVELERGPVDLAEVAEGLVEALPPRYADREVRTETTPVGTVQADGRRVQRLGQL